MNNVRTKKFRGIDSPKVIFPIVGLLAISALGKIFLVPVTGVLMGICMGIILSFFIRVDFAGKEDE